MPAALRLCVQVKRGLLVVHDLALRTGKRDLPCGCQALQRCLRHQAKYGQMQPNGGSNLSEESDQSRLPLLV
jgi:hypothetical protein